MRGVLFWLHDGRVQEQTGCPLRGGLEWCPLWLGYGEWVGAGGLGSPFCEVVASPSWAS